jgi:hypothetical protein
VWGINFVKFTKRRNMHSVAKTAAKTNKIQRAIARRLINQAMVGATVVVIGAGVMALASRA